jgi:hypothetical protein
MRIFAKISIQFGLDHVCCETNSRCRDLNSQQCRTGHLLPSASKSSIEVEIPAIRQRSVRAFNKVRQKGSGEQDRGPGEGRMICMPSNIESMTNKQETGSWESTDN